MFSKFAAGTFAMLADRNTVQMAAGGRAVTLDSFADLAGDRPGLECRQCRARRPDRHTLVLSIPDADGDVLAVFIDHARAALI